MTTADGNQGMVRGVSKLDPQTAGNLVKATDQLFAIKLAMLDQIKDFLSDDEYERIRKRISDARDDIDLGARREYHR